MLHHRDGSESAELPEGEALRVSHPEPPGVLHHWGQDPRVRRQCTAQGNDGKISNYQVQLPNLWISVTCDFL